MEWHNWRCRECSHVLSQIGTTSLSFAVELHDKEVHGLITKRTSKEIQEATQYFTTNYAYTAAPVGRPSLDECAWLRRQSIIWDGDTRSVEELASRYRNKPRTV
jgi:hypothetical protein